MHKDIDLQFARHPVTGDVSIRTGVRALLQSVRNIVLTTEWDVPFDGDGWGDVGNSLGETVHSLAALDIQTRISEAIKTKEPRVEVVSVVATPSEDYHGYDINIAFYEVNVAVQHELSVPLRRVK